MSSVHPIGAERGLLNRAVVNVRARSGVALLRACAHRWALQSACDPDVRFILVTVNILTWFFDCSWLWLASWIGPSEKNQGDRKHVCLNSRCRTSSPSSPQSSPQTAWNSLTNSSKAGYSRPSCVCVCVCVTLELADCCIHARLDRTNAPTLTLASTHSRPQVMIHCL